MPNRTLTGRVLILPSVAPFRGGVLHVRVEDVSYADALAPTVAEIVIPDIVHAPQHGGAQTMVRFTVELETAIDADGDYRVRAWVERTENDRSGEAIVWSDQAYPVLTRGHGTDVTVTLGRDQRPSPE